MTSTVPAIQTVQRIGPVLELFSQQQRPWKPAEVAGRIGVSRATAHKLMSSMADIGLLRNHGNGRYLLGRRINELTDVVFRTAPLTRVSSVHLESMHANFGITTFLAVLDRNQALYVDVILGIRSVYIDGPELGHSDALYCTSVGKALLAFQDTAAVNRILPSGQLYRYTDATITDSVRLGQELQKVRSTGLAFDRGERMSHVHCVAAPILDADGVAVAALGVAAPSSQFDSSQRLHISREVRTVARRISDVLVRQ